MNIHDCCCYGDLTVSSCAHQKFEKVRSFCGSNIGAIIVLLVCVREYMYIGYLNHCHMSDKTILCSLISYIEFVYNPQVAMEFKETSISAVYFKLTFVVQ